VKKILVIDDMSEIMELIVEMLQIQGYKTFSADNGRAGVELARANLPDLVICDINMPDMDGYGVLRALREDLSTAAIPFIFLTGMDDRAKMRKGMESGADDYLVKPVNQKELLAAVEARFEKHTLVKRQSEKKLEDLRGNIALSLPHELLTPLTGILGCSSLLVEEGERMSPPEVKQTARDIYASGKRLHRLIENFLIYSQIELTAADPQKTAFLRKKEVLVINETVSAVAQQKARAHEREIELDLANVTAHLPINTDNFKKVLEEVLDNAFKFSPPGSVVRVESRTQEMRFTVSIIDHGRGMSPEQIKSIGAHMQFERRFHEQQGSGLGLVIAKRMTELHGGEFEIESVHGQDTTVRVTFPLLGGSSTFV
jgi:two-component system sensor histidine kinase/response regulator